MSKLTKKSYPVQTDGPTVIIEASQPWYKIVLLNKQTKAKTDIR